MAEKISIKIVVEGPQGTGASTIAALIERSLQEAGGRTEIVDPSLNARGLELRREAVKLQDPRNYPEQQRNDIANLQRTLVRRMPGYRFKIEVIQTEKKP